jgi:hypothetical protein
MSHSVPKLWRAPWCLCLKPTHKTLGNRVDRYFGFYKIPRFLGREADLERRMMSLRAVEASGEEVCGRARRARRGDSKRGQEDDSDAVRWHERHEEGGWLLSSEIALRCSRCSFPRPHPVLLIVRSMESCDYQPPKLLRRATGCLQPWPVGARILITKFDTRVLIPLHSHLLKVEVMACQSKSMT